MTRISPASAAARPISCPGIRHDPAARPISGPGPRAARFVSLLLALLILAAPLAASSEVKRLDFNPIGNAADLLAAISIYLSEWNTLIDADLGLDFSFNTENLTFSDDQFYNLDGRIVRSFSVDGISFTVEDDLTAYDAYILFDSTQITPPELVRILALINAVAYDFPNSKSEMTSRFIETLTSFGDFLEEHRDSVLDGNTEHMKVTTEKGTFSFDFLLIRDRFIFRYADMILV